MIKKRLILASGAAMLLSACTDEVPEIPASELYTREFVKEFGAIDGRQDWNNASRGSVQVSTATSSRVRVTTVIGDQNYLLADYKDVQGKRTIAFDIPKGVTEITVSDGITNINTELGGFVDFGSVSRSPILDGSDPKIKVTRDMRDTKYSDEWLVVPWIDATRFTRKMPEECYNANREGVVSDFMFKATGNKIMIRPLYWQTSADHIFGLYYIDGQDENDEDKVVYVPVWDMGKEHKNNEPASDCVYSLTTSDVLHFKIKNDDPRVLAAFGGRTLSELPVQDNVTEPGVGPVTLNAISEITDFLVPLAHADAASRKKEDGTPERCNYLYRWTNTDLSKELEDGTHPVFEDGHWEVYYTHFKYSALRQPGYNNNAPAGDSDNWDSVVSKGIEVEIEEGLEFGVYINNGSQYFHSMASRNDVSGQYLISPVGEREGGAYDGKYSKFIWAGDPYETNYNNRKRPHYAATWKGTKYGWTYFGFEDWSSTTIGDGHSDTDLNDLVFIIDGLDPVQVVYKSEARPIKWVVACEDLGNTDDFDFNDVVFEVEHVAGYNVAKITPLAAGGTLETYLYRMDESGNEVPVGSEWHAEFGGKSDEMINTTIDNKYVAHFNIIVPEDFSLASSTTAEGSADENANYRKNMGGFFLKVMKKDGSEEKRITPPNMGDAPQMILIYQGTDKKWSWPIERHNIKNAYPNFADWMNSGNYEVKGDGSDWFDKPAAEHVINRVY